MEVSMVNTNRKTLALVVRVSDVKGRDKKGDRFIAPEEQVRNAEAYSRGRGFEVQAFQDLNVSHTTPLDARPGMGEALRLIEAGELAGLVVSSQDRLGPLDITRELKARLLAAGAVLLVPDNPAIEELEAKGYKKLPGESMALIHEAQREEIGLRWAASRRAAIARGVHICRVAPIGLRKHDKPPYVTGKAREELTSEQRWADPVEGQLVPGDQKIVAAIKECFRIRARRPRGAWSDVCQVLENAGALNSKGEPYWTRSAAARIVENPAYKGVAFHGKDIRNPNAHEPVVDELTWKRAQVEEESAPTRGSVGALLGGVVRCATCGRKLTPSLRDGRYRCRSRIIAGPPCSAPANCSARDIEPYVVKTFLNLCAYRPSAPTPPDLSHFEESVARAEAALAKWQAQAAADEVDPEDFRPVLDARKRDLEAAETVLAEARHAAGLDEERVSLLDKWDSLTVPEQRTALHMFEVEAFVQRGREPVDERTTIVMRGSPIAEGWEPDDERYVIYSWGDKSAALEAHFTDVFANDPNFNKIVVEPIKLSPELKEAEEAIFGKLTR
jgi:DNA invertase Pin-like site-specific DNA recombinase